MSDSHSHGPSGDEHAHDDFDPEPATQLSADETPTAAWVPIVGAGLFLIGGVVFLVKQSDAAPGSTSASASASAAQVAPSAPAGAPPTDPAKRQELADQKRRVPRLPASGSATLRPAAPLNTGAPPAGQPPLRPAPTGRP